MNKDRLQMYISLTKITIVLCWLSLFLFWAIKLFGYNLFEIMVENENFLEFSQIVQNTWVKYLVSFITIVGGNYLLLGAIAQKFYFKGIDAIVAIFVLISMWGVSNFVPLSFINLPFWYGYVAIIAFGVYIQKGWKRTFGIIAIALQFVFTSISMLARNVSLQVITDYLAIMILIIDSYIMFALYYLYSNIIRLNKEK